MLSANASHLVLLIHSMTGICGIAQFVRRGHGLTTQSKFASLVPITACPATTINLQRRSNAPHASLALYSTLKRSYVDNIALPISTLTGVKIPVYLAQLGFTWIQPLLLARTVQTIVLAACLTHQQTKSSAQLVRLDHHLM